MPEWKQFQKHFGEATGLNVELVEEVGSRQKGDDCKPTSEFCRLMASTRTGRDLCAAFREKLMIEAERDLAIHSCEAGLMELVFPFIVSGLNVGYLVVGGFRVLEKIPDLPLERLQGILARVGIEMPVEKLREVWAHSPALREKVLDAYISWLRMAVRDISARLTSQIVELPKSLPEPVEKACRIIQEKSLMQTVDLNSVARECGICAGHLSRLFRHSTGLTFTEYVARFRAEHAMRLLRETRKTVSEIAFESGFNSISQFHRVFRQIYGKPPGSVRRENKNDLFIHKMGFGEVAA